jgi:hypothetical protein
MPYILFYADEKDFRMIREYFSMRPEVAFIIPDGSHRWRAVSIVPRLKGKSIALWHVLSGPLPLLHPPPSNKTDRIRDPWRGWKELFPGADRTCPYTRESSGWSDNLAVRLYEALWECRHSGG